MAARTPSLTTEPHSTAGAPRRQPRVRLWMVSPGAPVVCIVGPAEVVLGRAPAASSAVIIDHPTVSREHARITFDAGPCTWSLRDLASRNGTWVEGEPVGAWPRALANGSVLRLGQAVMVLEVSDTSDSEAPSGSGDLDPEALPGVSAVMESLRAQAVRVAREREPLLLLGETGTGKEHLAAELHRLSGRDGPLVPVNCAEIARELAESQLFGHGRGAFTGATRPQPGLFRAAHRGTLFLDEIGDLPLDLQPKLLRVLQDGQVRPVGETRTHPVDVRVLAATNRDVPALVEAGLFRRDLYARLGTWELRMPPLRARRPDLAGWVERFADRARNGRRVPLGLDAEAWEALLLASWPDNLRGLDRVVRRLLAQGGDPIRRADVAPLLPQGGVPPLQAGSTVVTPPATSAGRSGNHDGPSRRPPVPSPEELAAVLAAHGGSVRAVAKALQRDRRQIYRWLRAYGLRS